MSVLELPFVTDSRGGNISPRRCFWSVVPSGNIEEDNQTGKLFFNMALNYSKAKGEPTFINWMIIDMDLSPENRSGIELGFLSELSAIAVNQGVEL